MVHVLHRARTWGRRRKRFLLWVCGAPLVVVVAVGFLYLLLGPIAWELGGETVRSLEGRSRAQAINSVRQTLLYGVGGLAVFGSLIFTARNHLLARRQHALEVQGQVTDRFTNAVEQLGSENKAVRTGAVYALERIMRDSAADHGTILEVLATYVREDSAAESPPELAASAGTTGPSGDEEAHPSAQPASADVGAAMTVLARRPYRPEYERAELDLREANLRGIELPPRANLRQANLTGAELQASRLTGAFLHQANLSGAALEDALLANARLKGANMVGVRLQRASLVGAHLVGARVARGQLEDTSLTDAKLQDADLVQVRFQRAVLVEAELQGAWLAGAQLTGSWLMNAQLQRATLVQAELQEASLAGAHLQGADLSGAKLYNTDLSGADLREVKGLTVEQLLEATWSASPRLDTHLAADARVTTIKGQEDRR